MKLNCKVQSILAGPVTHLEAAPYGSPCSPDWLHPVIVRLVADTGSVLEIVLTPGMEDFLSQVVGFAGKYATQKGFFMEVSIQT